MKNTLLTIVITLIGYFSYAQTNTFPSTGNVGIGTTSPLNGLHVSGSSGGFQNGSIRFGHSGVSDGVLSFGWNPSSSGDALKLSIFDHNAITGQTDMFSILSNGNIGIGTTNPRSLLSIVTGADNTGAFFPPKNALIVGSDNALTSLSSNLAISSNSPAGANVGASIGFGGLWLGPGDIRDLEFGTIKGAKENNTPGDGASYLAFGTYGIGGMTEKVHIASSGNVGIGTTTPDQKLSVAGTIHSKAVTVDLTGWPDYVFKPTYHLPTLAEIKTYINLNHHLPEIPSEQEVAKDGINLGEINKLLTKKVEEMTLYLIEEDKQNKNQQQEIDQLKQQLNTLLNTLNKN